MAAERDDLNVGMIVLVVLTSAILLLDIIFGLEAWYNFWRRNEITQKVVLPIPEEYAANLAKQETQLHGYGWADRQKGVVRIPVEEAMKQVQAGKGLYYAPTAAAQTAAPGTEQAASAPAGEAASPETAPAEIGTPTAQEQAPAETSETNAEPSLKAAQPAPESAQSATGSADISEATPAAPQPEQ